MPTTIKQALKKWEEATQRKAAEAKEIKLVGVSPPIGKIFAYCFANLENCGI